MDFFLYVLFLIWWVGTTLEFGIAVGEGENPNIKLIVKIIFWPILLLFKFIDKIKGM